MLVRYHNRKIEFTGRTEEVETLDPKYEADRIVLHYLPQPGFDPPGLRAASDLVPFQLPPVTGDLSRKTHVKT